MIRPVAGTIATRVLVMIMNLGVIMLAGHAMGARGLGDISLVVLAITFIMLLANVIGGGAITYLLPRHRLGRLLLPSYCWALLVSVIAFFIVDAIDITPEGTELHVAILAFIQSIYTIHFNVLLGRQRIDLINVLQLLHAIVLLAVFAFLLNGKTDPDVFDYVGSAYAAFTTTAIGSVIALLSLKRVDPIDAGGAVLPVMLRQGGFIQAANFLQLLNYRLVYYLLERGQGLAALGIYSVGNQLAESAWLGPKSIGSVLYGKVSNTNDEIESQRLTILAAKAALAMAIVVLAAIVLVPDRVFQWVFGSEIQGITQLVLLLSPGIVAMSVSQALSHYFSGTGRNIHNVIGSGLGVIVTLILGPWLVPEFGASGAAITASLAYSANVIYQAFYFLITTRTPWSFFLPNAEDIGRIRMLIKRIR